MVAIFVLPAASASWGVSPIATASGPSTRTFFETASKMSGLAGFLDVVRKGRHVDQVAKIPQCRDTYPVYPSWRRRRRRPHAGVLDAPQQIGACRKRADQWEIVALEAVAAPFLHLRFVLPLRAFGQELPRVKVQDPPFVDVFRVGADLVGWSLTDDTQSRRFRWWLRC